MQTVTTGPADQSSSLVPSDTPAIPETTPSGEPATTDGTTTENLNTGNQQDTSSGDTLTEPTGSSDEVTTAPEPTGGQTTIHSDDQPTSPSDGQITTPSDGQTTVAPELTETENGGLVIVPVTTPVPNVECDDNGIKIPCDIWFFNLCIAPIEG
ncbi:hypothetical protein NW767_010566 [Fusarium falciforme]|nr:hypothetical protein NW767_010566 [Fusarium falciforme]